MSSVFPPRRPARTEHCAVRAPETPRFPSGSFTPCAHEVSPLGASVPGASNSGPRSEVLPEVRAKSPRAGRSGMVPMALVLLVAALVAVVWTTGLPSVWWPQIGNAFATSSSQHPGGHEGTAAHRSDPCDLVAGPAADYCHTKDGEHTPAPHGQNISTQSRVATAALGAGALAAGVGALVVLRRRP
ncbi:hypothetical protein ACIBK8_28560 [Streptomyces sp. NPDC050161]|uniref:hypothetical protein n=1 Tax=Streptomyces sp. NPDC050161 TaxID=3365604 RepID=UPI0037AD05A0